MPATGMIKPRARKKEIKEKERERQRLMQLMTAFQERKKGEIVKKNNNNNSGEKELNFATS